MITLYGIGDIFEGGHGETKDLRVQWALEEVGLDYRFHALDQTAGDLDSESYARISPFHQVPVSPRWMKAGITAPWRRMGGADRSKSQCGKPLGGMTREPPGHGASVRLAQAT